VHASMPRRRWQLDRLNGPLDPVPLLSHQLLDALAQVRSLSLSAAP
jgi:hypothetical protein